jgi:radical SAM protein with 4Fe4S-binding SPASM domain
MERPRLRTIIFEVTQACDHSCLHCYNFWNHPAWQGARRNDSRDLRPLLAHVLDQIECQHVTLTGGEPLLRADLPEIIRFLNRRGVGVTVISNGHRLTEDRIRDLIDCGVGLFELPLLSYHRTVHDELSGSAGAFDAVLAALANIRYHGGRVVTVFVATRRNIGDLHDTLKLAFAFGVQGVMLNRFNPGGRGAGHVEELLPSVEELHSALETAEAAAQGFRLPISCSIPIQPCLIDTTAYKHLGFGFCAAGSERAYYTLGATGDVRPCNHTPTVLGNAWHEPFAAIVHPSRVAGFMAAIPPYCEPCPRRAECQGGCKASAQVCYGDLCAEEPFLQLGHSISQRPKEENL